MNLIKNISKVISIAGLLFIFCDLMFLQNILFAQSMPNGIMKLSVRESVKLAYENSEDIKISRASMDRMGNKYREVRSVALPSVTGEVGWARYYESPVIKIGGQEFPITEDYEAKIGATLSQVIWAFGKVSTAIDIAQESIEQEGLSYKLTRREITSAVRKVYYTILYAQDSLEVARNSYDNALKNRSALKKRFKYGRTSKMDNVKMEADIAVRIPQVLQAENRLSGIMKDFRRLTGIEDNILIEFTDGLEEDFPNYNSDELKSMMHNNEPELKILRKSIEIGDLYAYLKKKGRYPTLNAFATYDYSGNGSNTIPEDDMNETVVAGLNLTWRIWDSGAVKGEYKQAVNEREMAKLRYDKKLKELNTKLEQLIEEHESSKDIYKADKRAFDLAGESYNIVLQSFSAGKASLTQLNDAMNQLSFAELNKMSTLYNINILMIEIDNLISGEDTL